MKKFASDNSQQDNVSESYRNPKNLTCYTKSSPDSGLLARIELIVKVGPFMERENEKGLSHFVEHMSIDHLTFPYLKRCEHLSSEVPTSFHRAYTSFNETVYLFTQYRKDEKTDSIFVTRALSAIREILSGEMLSADSIERVRDDVRKEYDSFDTGKETAVKALFRDEFPELRLPIGDILLIDNFGFEDVVHFHRQWYTMNNAAIVICSNLEQEQVAEIVRHEFSDTQINVHESKEIHIDIEDVEDAANHPCEVTCHKSEKNREDDEKRLYFISKSKRSLTSDDEYVESLVVIDLTLEIIRIINGDIRIDGSLFVEEIDTAAEIFSHDWHLIRIRITLMKKTEGIPIITNCLKEMNFNENDYQVAKERYTNRVDNYLELLANSAKNHRQFMHESVQNFLYDEPILDIDTEVKYARQALLNISYEDVKKCADFIMKNLTLISPSFTGFQH
ncbi:MAG: insulinase family protein [Lachnospiraceae bacterium]|jgi:hypothetical protein|nr:insulinase family protein [Lachnospiraceae bacterium]